MLVPTWVQYMVMVVANRYHLVPMFVLFGLHVGIALRVTVLLFRCHVLFWCHHGAISARPGCILRPFLRRDKVTKTSYYDHRGVLM